MQLTPGAGLLIFVGDARDPDFSPVTRRRFGTVIEYGVRLGNGPDGSSSVSSGPEKARRALPTPAGAGWPTARRT
jgi:hypothetical protein